jgi:hypothetical protein
MKYLSQISGTRVSNTHVIKNICNDRLPVEPIVRVAWIREGVITAEVIAGTGILKRKREIK